MKFVAQGPLRGIVRTPGDKSVSHRAVLLGAMADGVSVIRGLSDGDDVAHTLAAVVQLGAAVTRDGATVTVDRRAPPRGGGPGRLRELRHRDAAARRRGRRARRVDDAVR